MSPEEGTQGHCLSREGSPSWWHPQSLTPGPNGFLGPKGVASSWEGSRGSLGRSWSRMLGGAAYLLTTGLPSPQMQVLRNPRVWLDAATQIFFSLSLAFGGHIAFASYNPPR